MVASFLDVCGKALLKLVAEGTDVAANHSVEWKAVAVINESFIVWS